MVLKDIVNLLVNRINQPHVIECYLRKVYAKGYNTGAEWQAEQSPWISVEERFPDYDKSAPLRDRNRYIVRVVSGSVEQKISYTLAWLTNSHKFNVEMDWVRVTHWMPIPKLEEE